jgi:hypothetical protein
MSGPAALPFRVRRVWLPEYTPWKQKIFSGV